MSVQASTWFATQYANRAMEIYQTRGNRLRPTVTEATRFKGAEKAVFFLAGKTVAKKKQRGERNIPGNSARKKFEVALHTWVSFDTVEEFDMDRMPPNEREIVYTAGANALGRATDMEIYKVAHAAVDEIEGAGSVGGSLDFSANAFGASHAMRLCSALQDDKVPWDGQVYCGLPSLQWNQFLANKVVNSAEHVGSGNLPFVQATDNRFWNGVNWFLQVEEDAEDFYQVPAANKQDLLIWHKSAMGWAAHTDLRVIPQWDNYEEYWTINMQAKGAAVALQLGKGIQRFRTSSNSEIAIV